MENVAHSATAENAVLEIAEHFNSYCSVFRSGDSVLDVGIGTASASEYIVQNKQDISLQGLDVVDIRKSSLAPLTLYNGMTFPFNNKLFDVSVSFHTLRHIKWPLLTLGELARVTKRHIVVIEDFARSDCNLREDAKIEMQERHNIGIFVPMEYSPLGMTELENMFSHHKMSIRKKERLKTLSSRKIDKYLYILDPNNDM